MKGNLDKQRADTKLERSRKEWTILLQCAGFAVIFCVTIYAIGKLGAYIGFNFLTASLSILLIAVSLLAKSDRAVRGIAVAGMVITTFSVYVNPPWSAATHELNAAQVKMLAYEFLSQESMVSDEPAIIGDSATVKVTTKNQECVLTMNRAKGPGAEGHESWLVTDKVCTPVK